MSELSSLFGLFASGIGIGTILCAFYAVIGTVIAFLISLMSRDI